MKLHYRTLGEGDSLLIIHGIFGSSDNWRGLANIFARDYHVLLPDMRNHGHSPHSEVFDYDCMVQDVLELMEDRGIERARIIGHSMGGKVAMHLASRHPNRVEKPVIIDIAPKYYPPHHQRIFEGFRSVDLWAIRSRGEADGQLAQVIPEVGIRQFILKNLARRDGGEAFHWRLNVGAIERGMDKIGQGLAKGARYDSEMLFIAGGESDYLLPKDHLLIRSLFPKAQITTIEGAGHWVHAEKPRELAKRVLDFMA